MTAGAKSFPTPGVGGQVTCILVQSRRCPSSIRSAPDVSSSNLRSTEVDSQGIDSGMPARITVEAFGDTTFEGWVRRIAPFVLALEKQARTVNVEVEFVKEADIEKMLAGYSADVEIILETRSDVVRIPTEAVVDGRRIFVPDPGTGLLEERTIKVGVSNWDCTLDYTEDRRR